jgi:hypothetical protein
MTRLAPWLVAALVLVSVGAVAGTGSLPGSGAGGPAALPSDAATQMNDSDTAPTGGLVSSVIGMEEASVDASVTIDRFETRLGAAGTDAERAAVVATALNASRMEVRMLEMRRATLEARLANDTISQGWFDVETSWLLSQVETQDRVVERLHRAARTVPREALSERNATVADVERLQERIDGLLTVEAPEVHRTTLDRQFYRQFAAFAERFNDSAGSAAAGQIDERLAGERVTLHITSDMGAPVVLSLRMTDDARITEIRAGHHPDATVRLRLNVMTARGLVTAENPRQALSAGITDGNITVQSLSS